MKKVRSILCLLVVIFAMCAFAFAGCADTPPQTDDEEPGKNQEEQAVPESIALSGMKTAFAFGEEFTSEGLTVTVTMSDDTQRTAQKSEYTCDSSNYDKDKAGTYTIAVKLNGYDISATYSVSVAEQLQPVYSWDDDGALKILTIGNSFSDDTMEYAWQIADSLGVEEICLGNLYIGGCSIDTHLSNAENDAAAYDFRYNIDGTWNNEPNFKMGDAIASQDWDFVSLQQASADSGMESTYSNVQKLADYVAEKLPSDAHAQLVWNMTWAYQGDSTHSAFPNYNNDQMTMYQMIVQTVQSKICPNDSFSKVIPCGTAIQNARTSFVGDTLTRDGYHLTTDLGRYIAGLTLIRTLTGLSVENIAYAPANVNSDYKAVAIEAAENAVAEPFAVTTSDYTERPVFDPEGYVLIDPGFTPFAYYNSQDAKQYDILIENAPNSKQFYVTERLTKADLPVGSVIFVEDGWQYRPEGWTSNAPQSSRPGLVSIYRVDVTEEWWGDYIYRAFNLAKTNNASLTGVDEETVLSALKLYVPEDLYVEKSEPDLENDYELVDLELTGGFYDSTLATNYNTPITDNAALSSKFFASKTRFTKDTLPVGSVIVLEAGWQYRPEAWTSDTQQDSRPGNTTAQITIVTEEWWHGLQYRAFNISKIGLPVLTGQEGAARAALKIYIPKT